MLNSGSNARTSVIALFFAFGQTVLLSASSLYFFAPVVTRKHLEVFRRSVGRVGIHIAIGVLSVEQGLKNMDFMGGGVGDLEQANEFVHDVDADVILVAEVILAAALDPACVGVFLTLFAFAPVLGRVAVFDLGVFLTTVALAGRGDDAGVDDLTLAGGEPARAQMGVEALEQLLDEAGLAQLLAKQPDGFFVRHAIADAHANKAHERQAIFD